MKDIVARTTSDRSFEVIDLALDLWVRNLGHLLLIA